MESAARQSWMIWRWPSHGIGDDSITVNPFPLILEMDAVPNRATSTVNEAGWPRRHEPVGYQI